MQVSFKTSDGLFLASPGKGNHYWQHPPQLRDEVLLAPVGAAEPMEPYRVIRRSYETPNHLICLVIAADRYDRMDSRVKAGT